MRSLLTTLFMNLCSITAALATIGDQCDFDKYGGPGCYSRANFYCDVTSNQCICLPETPVLIEGKLCVKRSRENETCQYNEECDNDNGLYCSYSRHKLLNNCLHVALMKELPRGALSPPKCRCIRVDANARQAHQLQNSNSYQKTQSLTSHQAKQARSQQINQNASSSSSLPLASNLPRLVWLFLLGCLIGLILLLFMIKSEFSRLGRSRPRQEDRISINSEADVPPPYEVAIRMKL